MAKRKPLAVGDTVAYTAQWLRSTGEYVGPLGHAKGHIVALDLLGGSLVLATVDWDTEEAPNRVNVANLCKPGPNLRYCSS